MASAETLERHLSCSICLEFFNVPKTLPCVHTFCEACLDAHIRSSCTITGKNHQIRYFECPMCRVQTCPVNKEAPVAKWAKDFPSNPFVNSVLEETMQKAESSLTGAAPSDRICDPCSMRDMRRKVFCFCIDCCEYLCENCHCDHSKFKLMRSHTILKGLSIPKGNSHFKRMSNMIFCETHKNKEVEYRCLGHKQVVCSACIKTTHKNCDFVEDITALIYNKDTVYPAYIDSSLALKQSLEKILQNKINNLETIGSKVSIAQEQRRKLISELKSLIGYMESNAPKYNQEEIECEKANLSVSIAECTGFNDILNKDAEFAETVMKFGSQKQITVLMEELYANQSKVREGLTVHEGDHAMFLSKSITHLETEKLNCVKKLIEEILQGELDGNAQATVSQNIPKPETIYVPTVRLGGIRVVDDKEQHDTAEAAVSKNNTKVETINVGMVGGIHAVVTKKEQPPQTSGKSDSNGASAASNVHPSQNRSRKDQQYMKPFIDCNVRRIAQHHIGVPKGYPRRPPDHLACVLLGNDDMVFIDASNDCVKVVSPGFMTHDYLRLDETPNDVSLINENRVVVALDKSICIYMVSDTHQIRKERKFLTQEVVFSVTMIGEDFGLLFSEQDEDTDESSVQIRSSKNRIVDNIDTFRDKDGIPRDLDEPYLIRSRRPDEILVCEAKQLKAFDLDGDLKWYFKHRGRSTEYIAFDSDNNIYLCDVESRKIFQVSVNSYKRNCVLVQNTGAESPRCILINSKERTLIVGFLNNDLIEVYQFC